LIAAFLTPAYPALLAFAAVLLAIGAAVFIAAYGISLLVDSVAGLVNAMAAGLGPLGTFLTPGNVVLLFLLGLALTAFAIGVALLGVAMLLLIPGAYLFSLVLSPMNEMVKDLSTTVASISDIFTTISELSVGRLLGVAGALWKISNAIESFADKKINVEFKIVGDRADFDSIIKLASMSTVQTTAPSGPQMAQKAFKIEIAKLELKFGDLGPLEAKMISIAEGVFDGSVGSNV